MTEITSSQPIIFPQRIKDIDIFISGFSVYCIIIGFHNGHLKVLLDKVNNFDKWILPLGFLYKNEDMDDAALRINNNRTGLKQMFFKQFSVFADVNRPHFEDSVALANALKMPPRVKEWYLNRFVSVGYYSLVKYEEVTPSTKEGERITEWFSIDKLPELFRDHNDIIKTALRAIRQQVGYIPLGYELLPEKFTMPELRTIYETVIGNQIDRRNFQRKMLTIKSIKRLNESRKNGPHKAPILYSFVKEEFEEAIKNGTLIADLKMLIP